MSPHKISTETNVNDTEILSRDLVAINEFLHFVEAEPYLNHEKTENFKRVSFKKV